jgi:endonuclease YncB( thermonuclease family)
LTSFKKDSSIYRFSVRLNGIDTPEMKGKGINEDEKQAAHDAQKFVSDLILNKYVVLKNIKNEKYGRILADVYINNIHLNELLIRERYAVPYKGDTKVKPTSWLRYKLTVEL